MSLSVLRRPGIWLGIIICLYAALSVTAVARQGISWDEQTDLAIARSYLIQPDGWLVGSQEDLSQTRLPMAAVALAYQLLDRSDLILARLISILVGALTLIGVYRYSRARLHPAAALLACALLATSPFYLSFARVAFTETDIYLACTLIWVLVSADRLQQRFTMLQAAWVGVLFGLALSAKATMLAVLPAVWFAVWQASKNPALERPTRRMVVESAAALAWSAACIAGGVLAARLLPQQVYQGNVRNWHFLAVLCGWIVLLAWVWARREKSTTPILMATFITGMALLTFLVLPPEHLTNPGILRGINWRLDHEMTLRFSFIREAAALHLGSIVFKSSPLIGGGMLLALALTLTQWRQRSEIRLPALMVLGYFGGLVLLPLAQTFYSIPILPLLAVFLADQLLRLFKAKRKIAAALMALGVLSLGIDLALCYPDYNLNGYQWLGARPIAGRSSIGYRSIVQVPSDGIQQAFEWLNENAQPGEQVLAYVLPWHIVEATAPDPSYQITSAFQEAVSAPDYIVTEINTQIPQSWWTQPGDKVFDPPYNPAWLEKNYTRVFSVTRAFGIEMAAVWQRK